VVASAPAPSRREKARAATVAEIKATALDLMRESGTTDVRFTDIAKVMGMTPPALYRYYADRDELLTDLITDSYVHLGEAIAAARDGIEPDDIAGRWLGAASAYRAWARHEPQRVAQVGGLPVPRDSAPDGGPTTEAAKGAMAQLADLFVSAVRTGQLSRPLVGEVSPAGAACAHEKHPELDGVVPEESFQAMLQAWASLHGFTSLEAYGHLDWCEPEARDALFLSHVQMVAKAAGLPAPG
jgi:AcrR family transcriptional regulator